MRGSANNPPHLPRPCEARGPRGADSDELQLATLPPARLSLVSVPAGCGCPDSEGFSLRVVDSHLKRLSSCQSPKTWSSHPYSGERPLSPLSPSHKVPQFLHLPTHCLHLHPSPGTLDGKDPGVGDGGSCLPIRIPVNSAQGVRSPVGWQVLEGGGRPLCAAQALAGPAIGFPRELPAPHHVSPLPGAAVGLLASSWQPWVQ